MKALRIFCGCLSSLIIVLMLRSTYARLKIGPSGPKSTLLYEGQAPLLVLYGPPSPPEEELAKEPPIALDQMERVFAWFDRLDYRVLATAPFVRVATGEPFRRPGRPPKNSNSWGFLIKDQGQRFDILS